MPSQPLGRLEFTDCLGCGKRVATSAPVCRHCNTSRTPAKPALSADSQLSSTREERKLDADGESHAALGLGGYGKDDFDDDVERGESGTEKKTLWWYVALVLLIVFTLGALVPWF